MTLLSRALGTLLLRKVSSGIFGDGALPYGTALRKLRMVRLKDSLLRKEFGLAICRDCSVTALSQLGVLRFGFLQD